MKRFLLLLVLLLVACDKEKGVYTKKVLVAFEQPINFPEPTYNFENNPLTDKGIELGKKLFFDGDLSSDGTISCGFCHEQTSGFTHHGHQFSHGVDGREGIRNTQPLHNLAFQQVFGWDGATAHLDMFPIVPITNEVEMDETVANVVEKIKHKKGYTKMYESAFDDGVVTAENTFKALSQFMLTMVSANSKYDKFIRNEDGVTFSKQEERGLALFKEKCSKCHSSDLFTDDSFRNNGLPIDPSFNDLGREKTSFDKSDRYKFKVPNLRNVQVTDPYMHDGRFLTLKAVLNFYDNGVQETENLDPLLKNNGRLGIPLTEEEKDDLIVFLKTLTDNEFLEDKRFQP